MSDLYFVLDYDFNLLPEAMRDFPYQLTSVGNGLYILQISEEYLPGVQEYLLKYPYVPKVYGLCEITGDMNTVNDIYALEPLASSGILRLQDGLLQLTGTGVLVAVIDTGIQYDLPAFRDENGMSRIVAIWDQTVELDSIEPPTGFTYGTEFTRENLNQALTYDDPYEIVPSRDVSGHGSAMAYIAAGSKSENQNRGAAYGSELLVVKLRRAPKYLMDYYGIPDQEECYADQDILMALKYVQTFQRAFNKPLVILLGLASTQGSHNGHSFLPDALSDIGSARNQVVVAAAGNEGEAAGHFHGEVTQQEYENGTMVELLVAQGEKSFVFEVWAKPPALFSIGVASPAGEQIANVPYRPRQSFRYTFLYSMTTITIDYLSSDQTNGRELILVRLDEPLAGIWQIHIYGYGLKQEGTFDIWLPNERFLHGDTRFLRPNPDTTITEPAGGRNVISVGAYQSGNGSFYQKSGRGFLSDGVIKPDLLAPGVSIWTPLGTKSGTSMAAAICAGACAQYMEWGVVRKNDLFVNSQVLRNVLVRGAKREDYDVYPNPLYGYGKLDLSRSFDLLAGNG